MAVFFIDSGLLTLMVSATQRKNRLLGGGAESVDAQGVFGIAENKNGKKMGRFFRKAVL